MSEATGRQLIITADDFGAGPAVDDGVLEGIRAGMVNTVSALANYPGSVQAITELHAQHPEVGVGVHLNLTSGRPLLPPSLLGGICDPQGNFQGLSRLLERLDYLDLTAIRRELRGQVERLASTGVPIDHLSSHHNVLAIYPPFLDIMAQLAEEYDAPLRTPVAASQTHSRRYGYAKTRKRAAANVAKLVEQRPLQALAVLPGTWLRLVTSKRRLRRRQVRHPDHLIDALFGDPREENLRHIIAELPRGVSELVVHLALWEPGQSVPDGLDPHEFPNRVGERRLITGPLLPRLLERHGVSLARYCAASRGLYTPLED